MDHQGILRLLLQCHIHIYCEFCRYKEPTEKLSQLVEALNTQRTEKLNRVKLVEKEKDELEAPKNEAMAYIKLENELSQYKYTLQQVYTFIVTISWTWTDRSKCLVLHQSGQKAGGSYRVQERKSH